MSDYIMDGSGIKRLRLLNDMGNPDVIECDGNDYVKERTCHINLIKGGSLYDVWQYDCCGYEFSESRTDDGASEIEPNYCPNCGAKVVDHD